MTDITIPPAALKAAENACFEAWHNDRDAVLAACLAMLKAWPGMQREAYANGEEGIFLPLTENTNEVA